MKRKRFLFSKKVETKKSQRAVGIWPNPFICPHERACMDSEKMVLYKRSQETQR